MVVSLQSGRIEDEQLIHKDDLTPNRDNLELILRVAEGPQILHD